MTPKSWDYDFEPVTGLARATFDGLVVGTGGGIAGTVFTVNTVSTLPAVPGFPGMLVQALGYFTIGDGGAGPPWRFAAGSIATPNGITVLQPTVGIPGRWLRVLNGSQAFSPKWAGVALGAVDDTTQFQTLLNLGLPIDCSGCLIPVTTVTIGATGAPSLTSDGTGIIAPAPLATTATRLLTVIDRDEFRLEGMRFVSPVSNNPAVQPVVDLAVFFNPTIATSRVWVRGCQFIGGNDGLNFSGDTFGAFVTDCLFQSTWRGGSTCNSAHFVSYIGCKFIGCGITNGAGAGAAYAGNLRIGSSTQGFTPELYEVIGCTFTDYSLNVAQEALDLSGNTAKNVVVANNNAASTGGNGFLEIKCGAANAGAGDAVYRRFNITGNNVQLPAITGIAFNLHTSDNTTTPAGKLGQVLISGNTVVSDVMPASSIGSAPAIVNGWNDVTITGNKFLNLGRGIELDGYGVDTDTISGIVIEANDIYVFANTIFTSTTGGLPSTIVDLTVKGNRLRAVQTVASFGATVPSAVNTLTFTGNTVVSDTTQGIDIRNVAAATIANNDFTTVTSCAVTQGTTPGAIDFIDNVMRSSTGNALTLTTGTAIGVTDNTVRVLAAQRTWTGAATVTAANNKRGVLVGNPTGTLAGAIGDRTFEATPAVGGTVEYVITTAGSIAGAVWSKTGTIV
jgi:hypothetical protein